jgi:hypothetical protein
VVDVDANIHSDTTNGGIGVVFIRTYDYSTYASVRMYCTLLVYQCTVSREDILLASPLVPVWYQCRVFSVADESRRICMRRNHIRVFFVHFCGCNKMKDLACRTCAAF